MREHNCISCGRLSVCTKVRRLVIADPDCDMIREADLILNKRRYLITGRAGTGMETLELCRNQRPDMLLIADVLPDMDGLEVVKRVLQEIPEIRCVLAVSRTAERMVSDSLEECGVLGTAYKPYVREELLDIMDQVKFL